VNSLVVFGLVTMVVMTVMAMIFPAMNKGPSTLLAIAAVITAATSLVGALMLFQPPS
jgi:hypothetical protein